MAALHTTWDLSSSSPTQGWSLHPLTLEAWHLSSWTAREVPSVLFRDHLLSPCALPSLSLGTRFFFLVHTCACKHTQSDRRTHRHPPPHPELKSLQVKHWCILEDFSNGLAESHMNNLKWTAGAPWLLCRVWNSGCGPGHAASSFSLPSSSSSFCPSPLGNKTSSHSRIGRSFWNEADTSLPAWFLSSFYRAAVFPSWRMTLSDPASPVPEAAAPFLPVLLLLADWNI